MEKEIFQQTPKMSMDIKQTSKGILYMGSLKINADSVTELDDLVDQALNRMKIKNLLIIPRQEVKDLPKNIIELSQEERELFEQLRKLRLDLSKKEDFPPYVIFHDSVLNQFAKLKPQTKEEMLKIGGVGDKRFERYGELFLEVIRNFVK